MQSIEVKQFSILLIDDDPDFSELLKWHLEKIPRAKITRAQNYAEALETLSGRRFDLIVSDWALGKGDAFELFNTADKMIEATDSKQPVLFISSNDHLATIHKFHTFSNFKPFSFMLKRFGPPLISLLAEDALTERCELPRSYGAFQ